jgi:hypothetical protein
MTTIMSMVNIIESKDLMENASLVTGENLE